MLLKKETNNCLGSIQCNFVISKKRGRRMIDIKQARIKENFFIAFINRKGKGLYILTIV